jgi:L-lactate dehydrogenase complex protein LldF
MSSPPAMLHLRQKRDRETHGIAEWEELRSLASAIKEHTLTHLDVC